MDDEKAARVCTRCVMDTSDPEIAFDDSGHCNHCRGYAIWQAHRPSAEECKAEREAMIERIKEGGHGKEYDCIIGLSGGTDSSYTALKVKQLGLRALAVHLDNGWDSELAVSNIEKLVKTLEIDLRTVVLNWEEFRDLQLAFLRASVSDAEIPTDHTIEASLYRAEADHGVSTVISGVNTVTEKILPHFL